MTIRLPFPSHQNQSGPSVHLRLRTTVAIRRYRPRDLSPFGAPEVAWRRSAAGMELVRPGASDPDDRVLLTLDGHWPVLRDPWRPIAAMLEETDLEYEALRPRMEPRALAVQSCDAALGMPPGEQDRPGSSRHYGAAAIDTLRTALRRAGDQPLAAEALARAREIVAAWDRREAADVQALARSGFALWRRIAIAAGYDPGELDPTVPPPVRLKGCSGAIQKLTPWYEMGAAESGKVAGPS